MFAFEHVAAAQEREVNTGIIPIPCSCSLSNNCKSPEASQHSHPEAKAVQPFLEQAVVMGQNQTPGDFASVILTRLKLAVVENVKRVGHDPL
jgi:hypothetical protein